MKQTYPFDLVPLPYDYDALEPYMDAETLHYHHDKHLKTYVDNLNNILKNYPQYQNWTLEDLLTNLDDLPEDIRQAVMNNAGGVYNHQMFFRLLHPPVNDNPMEPYLTEAFGSYEKFVEIMSENAMGQFGSGYAWLVWEKGNFKIVTSVNQNTPDLSRQLPLLNVDVWEHAYYLKHYNDRSTYLENWFCLIDWNQVQLRLREGMSGRGA